MISSKCGLIKLVGRGPFRAQDPLSFSLGIQSAELSRILNISNTSKAGGGGEDFEKALAATLGETAERYSMLFFDKDEMVHATYRDVADYAPHPDILRLYSREQCDDPARRARLDYFDEDSRIRWVWGHSLTSGEPRLVPAPLVYLNYPFDDDEAAIGRNASTGLAAGLTVEEALLTGLCEVIERDTFTLSWMHRRVGPQIVLDDPELKHKTEHRFHADHPAVDLKIFDTTIDLPVLSVFGVLRRPAEFGPALCVAAVSHLDKRVAIGKCLRELGQSLPFFRYLFPQLEDWEPNEDHTDLVSFDHHCMLYNKRPDLIPKTMAFVDEARDTVLFSELPDRSTGRPLGDLEKLISSLAERDFEVIAIDITTEDILDVGLRVVRVVVPGLMPMHGNHNTRYLGVKRLHEIPRQMASKQSGWIPGAPINPDPHPFP